MATNKLWVIKEADSGLARGIARELNISDVLARLLVNRGLKTPSEAEKFLFHKRSSLHDPFGLKGIEKAVYRVKKAIQQKEKIMVYGDYDVDGITSVAILNLFLKKQNAQVSWYIPSRLDEGYGLNMESAKFIKSRGISLLVAVDCGTTDKEEVDFLQKAGIDVIIIDHHKVQKEVLPDAFCIVNPRQPDCAYPFKELCAAGLVYKFVCALSDDREHLNDEFLDLVALGTVADVASQVGENRILTKLGLKKLSAAPRLGIKALLEAAGLRRKEINAQDIGFVIGPRINAGGRIGSPEIALRLILTQDKDEARELADILHQENSFRQKLQEGIFKEAVSKIDGNFNFKDNKVIVVWGNDWHPGVIGIVASKIVDRFYRPAIILNVKDGIARGSGRSIDNFHLFDAIFKCKDLLDHFGGHEAACGLALAENKVEKFKDLINIVARNMLTGDDLIPRVEVDMELPLSCLNKALMDELQLIEPFGPDNPQPLFLSENLRIKDSPSQFGKNGIKMWVSDNNITCEASSFRGADMLGRLEKSNSVDLVYYPKMREISGVSSFKLEIEDLRPVSFLPGIKQGKELVEKYT